ncbi:MAG: hypothetical protein JW829_19080 [Pirellulales bacterium]|nr:hypothetical protein [Pirellulales bacterium]
MTRTRMVVMAVAALLCAWWASPAHAQRGMGDSVGMAKRQVLPELVNLSGTLTAIETQPCKGGTGSGVVGTHIVLKTDKGMLLTIDLGWAKAVEPIVKQLAIDKTVEVAAFRTDKMPKGRYVAKSLTLDGKAVQLRDDNLRPFWAGRVMGWYSSEENSVDPDGPGLGHGRGWGRGRGWGGGRGRGWGRGWGHGYGW